MSKNSSQEYSFQSKINENFFETKHLQDTNRLNNVDYLSDIAFKDEFLHNQKETNIMEYPMSSKFNRCPNTSERNMYPFCISHEKHKNSTPSSKLHVKDVLPTPSYHLSSQSCSSINMKNATKLENQMQPFSHLHNTSNIWVDWKHSLNSQNQEHNEKSNLPYCLRPPGSSISTTSPSYKNNLPFKDSNLSLKSSLRSFSSSLALSNNSTLSGNSLGNLFKYESIKYEDNSTYEQFLKHRSTFSNIFSDFCTVKLKPNLSKKKVFSLLKKTDCRGKPISLLHASTIHLISIFKICNPKFNYELSKNPKRALTKPNKGTKNDGYDNEDNDYILYVNDILGSDRGNRYLILDILGQGTFGQVVKCRNIRTQEIVAVKVIKNKPAYFNQSMTEITILDLLNKKLDKSRKYNILQLKDTFIHKKHLCIVSELLSVNLYELIKQNQFKGLNTNLVRIFAVQILDAMIVLNEAKIIHCDLKPENILLNSLESPVVKIIDFGSACHERQTIYTYIQSRFYRSPEVLLGLPYSSSIDVWSFGCIIAELFLGLPLFPGTSEYNQIFRIVEMLGMPPAWMIEMGKQSKDFFEKIIDNTGHKIYCLKTMEQYEKEHNTTETPNKRYFSASTLPEIIKTYPMQKKFTKSSDIDKETILRMTLTDFLIGLLNINPLERLSPQQAKMHPFITGDRLTKKIMSPLDVNPFFKFPENTSNINHLDSSPNSQCSQKIIGPKPYSIPLLDLQTKDNSYIPSNTETRDSSELFSNYTNPLYLSTSTDIYNQSQESNRQKRVPDIPSSIPSKDFQKYPNTSNLPQQIYEMDYFPKSSEHSSFLMFQNNYEIPLKYPSKVNRKDRKPFLSF
ncbi:unnamed protein product [Pneumocystis jirovecii]|uniref:Protein kinase domain-containing protein n=1 Tax=Pneumocystis jirovecii TaxID=42068 RepID=L0P7L8_PNEJI|nr:unnamed protein product [Pneumocystis jirovecii]